MTAHRVKQDKCFPLLAHDNPLRRRFMPPHKLIDRYVSEGQTVADLGCGPGFFTLALAGTVGPEGKVYAVDSDERAVREVMRKAREQGFGNIEARAVSASRLGFIADRSVDFALCHGLYCSMAPSELAAAVGELKRILRPAGLAYLSVATGPWSYVGRAEWEKILGEFEVKWRKGNLLGLGDRAAVVSPKKS